MKIMMDTIYLSHALRTPLTGILGAAELVQHEKLSRRQSQCISTIIKAGQHILQLVEKIEQASRSTYKKQSRKKHKKNVLQQSSIQPSILLVEDNPIIQNIHSAMLKNLGFCVDIAGNGKQALQLFHSEYTAVLMDIGLPDQSGLEVTKKIRLLEKQNQTKPVPIIALTAFSSQSTQEDCMKVGISAFLTKPTTQQKLRKTIHFFLNAKTKSVDKEVTSE